jgi:acyl-CoA synthetase (AMP-forming)/AMP-acid ligase II
MDKRAQPPPTVPAVLDRAVRDFADRTALVAPHGRLTYRELDTAVGLAAGALARTGLRQGDRVAASLPNDVDIVVAFHAAMRLGAVWLGINQNLAVPEKLYQLRDAEASLLLSDPSTTASLRQQRNELPALREVVTVEADDPSARWGQLLDSTDTIESGVRIDPHAPAGVAYTSGTTGHPKGVVHSQYNLVLPGAATVASRGYDETLRKGDCLPLTILNMQALTTVLVTQAGGCCLLTGRRDAGGLAEWIRDEQVNTFNGVPAQLHSLAREPAVRPEHLASLDDVWSGGGDCSDDIVSAFQRKFGVTVHTTYGLTEAPTLVAIEARGAAHVSGSSGRVLDHLTVSVRDEQDRPVDRGETGELCVGPAEYGPWEGRYRLMLGYRGRPAETATTLRGGRLHTGDVGCLDGEGNLFISGRRSLVIVRGGANVYPAEIERVLTDLPGVTGCAAVGLPDERLGERVAAVVELVAETTLTAGDLAAHCAGQLARYKVPEQFAVVEQLPRNAMGKVERAQLRAYFPPLGAADRGSDNAGP